MRYSLAFLIICLATSLVAQNDPAAKKRGRGTVYYEGSKQKAYTGKYKKYKREGVWTYWRENGTLEKTETYRIGVLDGPRTEYYENGDLKSVANYKLGQREGKTTTYFQGNKKETELNYMANALHGEQTYWYENGNVFRQSVYETGVMTYERSNYFNGRPKRIVTFKNNKPNGVWRTYPDPQQVSDTFPEKVETWKEGKLHGPLRRYRAGVLVEEAEYTDGRMNGHFQQWDYSGLKTIDMYYAAGLKDGLCTFYNSGMRTFEGKYNNGTPEGKHTDFARNGNPEREVFYKFGRIDSTLTYYKNGKLASRRMVVLSAGGSGIVATRREQYQEYSEEGILLQQGFYKDAAMDGEWKTYYLNGAKKSITVYVVGVIQGKYEKWYSNGKKMIEFPCENNYAAAAPKVWDEKGRVLKPNTREYEEIVESSLPGDLYYDPNRFDKKGRNEEIMPIEERIWDETQSNQIKAGDDGPGFIEEVQQVQEDEIYSVVEEMPSFPGGNDAMMNFIAKNIRYPMDERESQIQGRVYVRFVVRKDGVITDVQVIKGVNGGSGLDKEAIRVVSSMPTWIPGKNNGKPVNVYMTLPIRFVLQ
jgi:TonB family protein